MSEIRATTISDAAGTGPIALTKQEGTKVRCAFDANPSVVIEESYGTSSMTDNGTGTYTVNFTNSLSSSTYAYSYLNNTFTSMGSNTSTASTAKIFAYNSTPVLSDVDKNMFFAVGDLA